MSDNTEFLNNICDNYKQCSSNAPYEITCDDDDEKLEFNFDINPMQKNPYDSAMDWVRNFIHTELKSIESNLSELSCDGEEDWVSVEAQFNFSSDANKIKKAREYINSLPESFVYDDIEYRVRWFLDEHFSDANIKKIFIGAYPSRRNPYYAVWKVKNADSEQKLLFNIEKDLKTVKKYQSKGWYIESDSGYIKEVHFDFNEIGKVLTDCKNGVEESNMYNVKPVVNKILEGEDVRDTIGQTTVQKE